MKKKLTEDEFVNWWLKKFHKTTIKQVLKDHPEWDTESDTWDSRTFYEAYPVTQKQHDKWYKWAITRLQKHYGISKAAAKKWFAMPYLNVAPMIKYDR